jgi:hypothetical protein
MQGLDCKNLLHTILLQASKKYIYNLLWDLSTWKCYVSYRLAENYIFMDFNEIWEIYWHSFQLIILAHVSYRWNLAYISDVNSGVKKLITEYH